MARHEFGMMRETPLPGVRYDEYEPYKYGCITVDDVHLEDILERFYVFDSFAHTLDVPAKGLVYTGITLIPPESCERFLAQIADRKELLVLQQLLKEALAKNLYVIHYGL